MSIEKNNTNNLPSSREIKRAKNKWESNINNINLFNDYIRLMWLSKKITDVEFELERGYETFKKTKSFENYSISYVDEMFDEINTELSRKFIDYYLNAKKDDFENHDFLKLNFKLRKMVKKRVAELNIELPIVEEKIINEPTQSPVDYFISKSMVKSQSDLDNLYRIFEDNLGNNWEENKDYVKAVFKVSKNIYKYDKDKAQNLLNFCLKLYPENGNYISFKNKWNPKPTKKVETLNIEIKKPIEVVKNIVISSEFSVQELFEKEQRLKKIFSEKQLEEIVDEFPTWFRKDRKWPSILISLANYVLKNLKRDDDAFAIYEYISEETPLREKEIRLSNILKYDILIAQDEFEKAKLWNDEKNLGIDLELQSDQKIEEYKEMIQQDESEQLFYKAIREQDMKYYYKRVDYYINDRQFKHKLGDEVSNVITRNIKEKIAIDLKYLDFEIRELLIPYFIKIEANAKIVLKTTKQVIGATINKSFSNYTDDMRFIMDVTKLKETEFTNSQLFYNLFLVYRIVRNHMVHGSLNLFGLRVNSGNRQDGFDDGFEEMISVFNTAEDDSLVKVFKSINKRHIAIDIFSLPIVEKVLSYDAIQNNRVFGIGLIILFMSVSRHNFLRIASEIDHKINMFKLRTVLGSKAKLYESLGLKPDWLKELSKIH